MKQGGYRASLQAAGATEIGVALGDITWQVCRSVRLVLLAKGEERELTD